MELLPRTGLRHFQSSIDRQRSRDKLYGARFRGIGLGDHHHCYFRHRQWQERHREYIDFWNRFERDAQRPIRFLFDIPDGEPRYRVSAWERELEWGRNGDG